MTRRFRFGICTDQNMTWEKTVERWQLFERLGYESAWLCDHLVQPSRPQGPYFEAWSLLAGLAARTEKIRVGILVTSNTFRYPQIVAKMAVTVDHIANGRLEIGLGAGWYEPEHTMFGIEFPETKELAAGPLLRGLVAACRTGGADREDQGRHPRDVQHLPLPADRGQDGGDRRPHRQWQARDRAGSRLVRARAHDVRHRVSGNQRAGRRALTSRPGRCLPDWRRGPRRSGSASS